MSDQLALFRGPQARATDPSTSHVAAASVHEPGLTEFRIVAAIEVYGPLTDDELCDSLPEFYPPTLKTARSRLSKRGLLVPHGTRLSHRGREMTVWTLAPEEAA